MVFDINFLRKNHDAITKSQKGRYKDASLVDATFEHHHEFINERFNADKLNEIKDLSVKVMRLKINAREIGGDNEIDLNTILSDLVKLTKSGISRMATESYLMNLNTTQIKTIIKKLDEAIATSKDTLNKLDINRMYSLNQIGNILHRDVIISDDLSNNQLIRSFGDTNTTKRFSYVNLFEMIGGAALNYAPNLYNSNLIGACGELETALLAFGSSFLEEKDFKLVSPNCFSSRVLFKRSDGEIEEQQPVATAEQRVLSLFEDKFISENELPIKYFMKSLLWSPISREVDLFNKNGFTTIDPFCITSPVEDESDKMFHEMIVNYERFYQALGIPYKVVSIVSGELDNAAAIKYQLEGWFPGGGAFRDLASCSNCTDYQSRSVLTRYGEEEKNATDAEYVHMLRGTLSATTKTICAILENYQTENGIVVPTVLRPLMTTRFREFIPFVNE